MLQGDYSMCTNRKLQYAVRLALGVSASTLALGMSPGALAQDDSVGELEEIVVTGSRIKRADLDSANPVTILDRADIMANGITDVGDLLQRMPSMSGSPIGTTTNNGGNGAVEIDLRGMGVDRTLTLVNGKRTVDNGDYQTIPAIMVERVEILKNGASAVYGADAVAGVVNIITRRDFEGLSIEAQQADFFDMDSGSQWSIGLIAGATFDRGNFLFGAEYVDQEEAFQGDAPWRIFQEAYYIYPAGCENQFFDTYTGYPDGGCYIGGSSRIPEGNIGLADGSGNFMNEGSGLVPWDGRLYNYAPVNYIQTPYKRTNLFAEANFDITDNMRFVGSLRGNLRTSAQELAPMPYDSRPGFDPGHAGVYMGTPYNGIHEDNFYLSAALAAAGLNNTAADTARRRMVETNRRFEQDINQYQANLGVEGTVSDIDWTFSYSRGHRTRSDQDFGQFGGIALHNGLGPSADLDADGEPECYTDISDPSTLVAGCVPLNFVGGPDTFTQDMIGYSSTTLNDSYVTQLQEWEIGFSGSLFDLPGGQMGWAAGAGYRDSRYDYKADSAKAQNAVSGSVGESTHGTLYSTGIYVEVLAPVFDNGSQALTLTAGGRYDEYNLFSGEATWQFGVEFNVIESLKLRATAGTVFRAPTIDDLFQGLADDAPTYLDPCIPDPGDPLPPGCAQLGEQTDSQLPARIGGNPLLTPETGDTLTAGLVWRPGFADGGLSVTVDYWKTELENGISSLGVQFILEDCYVREVSTSCDLITRTPSYNISEVLDLNLNVSEQGASGIDLEVRYAFDTGIGEFKAALLWAYLIERTKIPDPTSAEIELGGRFTDETAEDGGGYPRNKINYSVQWMRNNLSIGYLGEYIHSMESDVLFEPGYTHTTEDRLYHDIVANYEFGQGTTLSAGITNVTDEDPPFVGIAFNAGTSPEIFRMFGMGYYVRLGHAF
jgi:outer membrane receptor protein involved in Fe transport